MLSPDLSLSKVNLRDEQTSSSSSKLINKLPTKRERLNKPPTFSYSPKTLENNRRWLGGLFASLSIGGHNHSSNTSIEDEEVMEEDDNLDDSGKRERNKGGDLLSNEDRRSSTSDSLEFTKHEEDHERSRVEEKLSGTMSTPKRYISNIAQSSQITTPTPTSTSTPTPNRSTSNTTAFSSRFWNFFTPSHVSQLREDGSSDLEEECDTDDEDGGNVNRSLSGLLSLPDEILVLILSYLPPSHSHLLNISLVSRRFNLLSQSPLLWSNLIETNGYTVSREFTRGRAVLQAPGRWTSTGWQWNDVAVEADMRSSNNLKSTPSTWRERFLNSTPLNTPTKSSPRIGSLTRRVLNKAPSPMRPNLHHTSHDGISIHYPTLYRSLRQYERCLRDNQSPTITHTQVLSDHTDAVYSIHAAGQWLVTGGRDRCVRFYKLGKMPLNSAKLDIIEEVKLVKTLEQAHEGSVLSVILEPEIGDGNGWLLTSSSDHTAAIWELKWGITISHQSDLDTDIQFEDTIEAEQIVRLRGHTDVVLDIALTSRHIITCSKDGSIRVYTRSDFSFLYDLRPHIAPINALAIDPDPNSDSEKERILTGSGDGSCCIINLDTREEELRKSNYVKETENRSGQGIACVAWKGNYIATGSNGRMITVYDIITGRKYGPYQSHTDTVRALDIHLFGKRSENENEQSKGLLISGGYDKSVRILDLITGERYLSFGGNVEPSLDESLDEEEDNDHEEGDYNQSRRQSEYGSHTSLVLDVHLYQGRLISASHDQTVRIMTFGTDLPYRGLMI